MPIIDLRGRGLEKVVEDQMRSSGCTFEKHTANCSCGLLFAGILKLPECLNELNKELAEKNKINL